MPSIFQRLLADDKMKSRWKLATEDELYKPYDGDDDRKRYSVLFDFEYLLKRYSVWPSKEQRDAKEEKKVKQEEE